MASVELAQMALTLRSRLLFAGKPVLFKTNAAAIAQYAGEFFPEDKAPASDRMDACATITIHVRETDEPCFSAPWFRARGHFAFARFTRADAFWYNLRTREVYGECSPDVAADSWCWRVHILPTLLGILSPVIGVAPLHAACLAHDGRGVLLTGHAGAGKSTLTIALAKRGYALLSDEWTYLSAAESGVAVWGVPVPVKLLPDASRFYPELLEYRPTRSLNGETAYEVWPDECFGTSRQVSCAVRTIVLLERTTEPGCRISEISAAEAIDHLSHQIEPLEGALTSSYKEQLDVVGRLVDAQCLRLSFNDHPESVAEAFDAALAVIG